MSNKPSWAKQAERGAQPKPGMPTEVDARTLRRRGCKACKGTNFLSAFQFYEIPLLLRQAPHLDTQPLDLLMCQRCGMVQGLAETVLVPSVNDEMKDLADKATTPSSADGHGGEDEPKTA